MAELDCEQCGACCIVGGEVSLHIHSRDDQGPPRHMTRSVRGVAGFAAREHEYRRMARTKSGACVALDGEPGKACCCSIYDRRPSLCREFARGSEDCLRAREEMGFDRAPG